MKLNPDCTRDILIALEQLVTTGRITYIFQNYDDVREELHLTAYETDEIEYHLRQCEMAGLLVGAKFGASGSFSVRDISPKAHEFLANIHSDTVYHTVKEKLSKIGIFSIKAIVDVASAVAADCISKLL